MRLVRVLLIICLGATVTPAWAMVLHVPGDYPTIQAAIDAAVSGSDEVVVADGVYTGAGNLDVGFRGKAITVRSQNGPDGCILDGEGYGFNHRGFVFAAGESFDSVLDGFTVRNCWKILDNGGAILIDEASPTIRNCALIGNMADGLWGGGIFCHASNARIIDCVIADNTAGGYHGMGGGGGIWADGGTLAVEGCSIASNYSVFGSPGGLYVTNASIARTVIWGNCNDYGEGFDLAGHAVLTCCDVNLNGINPEGIVFDGPQAYTSPLFCDPTGCGYPPEFDGDYRVRSDSPCLPENSPCGELIGARGRGCDGVPVEEATWGRIKSMYF